MHKQTKSASTTGDKFEIVETNLLRQTNMHVQCGVTERKSRNEHSQEVIMYE
jgi:hypothetical protein